MARRRYYGYEVKLYGESVIISGEAVIVRWTLKRYLPGDSLGKITAGLERQGICSSSGKPKWNREAIDKLLSNEKYTWQVLLQKTISTGLFQIKNDGLMEPAFLHGHPRGHDFGRYAHDRTPGKLTRTKNYEKAFALSFAL